MGFRELGVGGMWVGLATMVLAACGAKVDTEPSARGSEARTETERVGSIGFRLQPVAGVTLSSIHYVITRGRPDSSPPPPIVAEGSFPSPGTGDTLSFGLTLPVGTNYFVNLSAVSAEQGDDITCSGSFGAFNVSANETSSISIVLVCVDNTKGQVLPGIEVETDACPRLVVEYAVAEPAYTDVGRSLQLRAHATDLDDQNRSLVYRWSIVNPAQSAVGFFSPSSSRDTNFTCSSPGDAVAVRVTADNGECSKSLVTSIACGFGDGCGNGVVDPGETCDPALNPLCPPDCTLVCGDGVVEGGEACDPVPVNPLLCYPPGHPQGCQSVPPPLCGNGVIDEGEDCEPAFDAGCSPDCEQIFSPQCVQCEQAGDCSGASSSCTGGNGSFTPEQRAACWDVLACVVQSGCAAGNSSLSRCYCGTLSTTQCAAAPFDLATPGAPNGPCAALMQKGTPGATSNSAVLGALTSLGRPTGAAGQRVQCLKNDDVCAPLCGLQ
jgi:hypothetical protein